MTVYELIQQLAEFPPDMPIMTSVVGEDVETLNGVEHVEIDKQICGGSINAYQSFYGNRDNKYCKVEVEL